MREITRTRTTIYKITQVHVDFMEFNETYVKVRKNMKNPMFNCFACHKKFSLGDKISIIAIEKNSNKVLCHDCAEEAKRDLLEENI